MHVRFIAIAIALIPIPALPFFDGFGRCADESSRYYGLPVEAVCAIAHTEGGRPGMAKQNKDGSYDLGVMQINDEQPWFRVLQSQGMTRDRLKNEGCENVWAGAYIIANEIYEAKDFWRGMGNYHNRRAPHHERYLSRVIKNWNLINEGKLSCK